MRPEVEDYFEKTLYTEYGGIGLGDALIGLAHLLMALVGGVMGLFYRGQHSSRRGKHVKLKADSLVRTGSGDRR